MNNNLLVPALLFLSLFATSSAYLDGARNESCYNHSIVHTVDLGGGEVINDPSTVCNTPCGYQLYVVGERAENGTLTKYETNTTTSFEYKLNTTYQFSLRIIMLAGGQETNGFVGFLVQARNYTDMFVPESSIHGTWEDNSMLYRPLNCGKSMANTSVLYPNSATQKLSTVIADIGGNNEVLLYWVSPAEQDDAVTVAFWYTIVQQHRAHFFPVRGPVGTPLLPTTAPTAATTAATTAPTAATTAATTAPTAATTAPTAATTAPTATTTDSPVTTTDPPLDIVLTLVEIVGISVGGVAAAIAGIIAIVIMAVIIAMCCCKKEGKEHKKSNKQVAKLWMSNPIENEVEVYI
ncbi:uncharacterized protein LOC135351637 isoform X2 [Halichondria panicea]|uniref:uncharacterized protein LOC135351637 isoform X2 n=1 Tax=Halichondria panicea TaxID=6063 RepID=UPI00312BA452